MDLFKVDNSQKKVFPLNVKSGEFSDYAERHGGRANAITDIAELARTAVKNNEEVIMIEDAPRGDIRCLHTIAEIDEWEERQKKLNAEGK